MKIKNMFENPLNLFKKTKKLQESEGNQILRQKLLKGIDEIERSLPARVIEAFQDIASEKEIIKRFNFSDVQFEINEGHLNKAKEIASAVSETNNEYYGAKSYMAIAQAEFEKNINPRKSIAKAKQSAKNIEYDPAYQLKSLIEIAKLEITFNLLEDAQKDIDIIQQVITKNSRIFHDK